MNGRSPLFGAAVLFSTIASLSFVFGFFSQVETGSFTSACLPVWACFLLAYHICLSRLLRRAQPVRRLAERKREHREERRCRKENERKKSRKKDEKI